MELNTQTINSIKNILCFPQRYGLTDIPLWRFFTITNAVTPQDKLYEQYVNYVQVAWPKVIFYIILRMMYKHYQGIDKRSGNFGYRLCFVTPEYSVSEAFLIWHKKTFLQLNSKNDPSRSKCINTILVGAKPILSTSMVGEPISASNSESCFDLSNHSAKQYAKRFSIEVNQPIMKEFLMEEHPATVIGDPVLASNRHSRRAEAAQKRKNKMK